MELEKNYYVEQLVKYNDMDYKLGNNMSMLNFILKYKI